MGREAVSLVGLYLLSVTGDFVMSKGDVLVMVVAVLWACQILAIDRVAGDGDPIVISLLQFAVCAILSLLAAVLFENWSLEAVKAGAGAVAFAGIMSVGVAFTLQVVGQKHCPPAPAAIIMSLEAVFAAIAGYLVLHQTMPGRALIGLHSDSGGSAGGAIGADAEKEEGSKLTTPPPIFIVLKAAFDLFAEIWGSLPGPPPSTLRAK